MSPGVLDPLTLPLHGAHLIEASAGTGKTWTIAALYLRLVLGQGEAGSAPARPLLPAEILVMTFTRAATRELTERIRARLAEAAAVLRGEQAQPDAFLAAVTAGLDTDDARALAAWRLTQAAQAMDDAAIHTIDAWCQRVLRDHALASNSPLGEALVADEAALLHEAVRDWWRQQVYPLPPEAFLLWQEQFASVDALAREVQRALPLLELTGGEEEGATDGVMDGAGSSDEPPALAGLLCDQLQRWQALKPGWAERADALEAWLLPLLAIPGKGKPFSGTKIKPDGVAKVAAALRTWATDAALREPALTDTAWFRYTPEGLQDALTQHASLPPLPAVVHDFEALREAVLNGPPLKARLLLVAARAIAARLAELKARQQVFGFADPLRRLEAALAGPGGEALRQSLLARYPAALVDEFQDTSPLQYRLFSALYRPGVPTQDTVFLLIGDPKQSIYGFRGADIYSYLRARADTAPNHHALGTNHRSTAGVVAAVNQLFAQAEERVDGGAFALRTQQGSLPFEPVAAKGRPERLQSSHGPVPALWLGFDAAPQAAAPMRRRWAALAAEQVVQWLNDPRCGFARDDGGEPAWQRLRPADIAVLVRDGKEARAIRQAFRARGLQVVYLSDRDNVFATAEAHDLLRWLQAVADPLDNALARAAYASPLLGLSWQQLAEQVRDEATWDARVALLRELNQRWQRHGVLAMLRQTIHRLDLAARHLAAPDGERRLTNLLHLAELLQAAGARLDGEAALLRWLAERIEEAEGGVGDDAGLGEERVLRLESDAGLVRVVTVHKSKGLEYPVVLLPFAASAGRDEADALLQTRLHGDGRRTLVLHRDAGLKDQHRQERLREDLRLLYVALTRARHALWLGLGHARRHVPHHPGLPSTAVGHLLGLAGVDAKQVAAALPAALEAALAPLQGQHLAGQPLLHLAEPPDAVPRTLLQRDEAVPPLQDLPRYEGHFDRDWAVGSYSSVVRGHATATDLPDTPAEPGVAPLLLPELRDEVADEPAPPVALPAASATAERAPWHAFTRGPVAGNFLHDQLQWLAERGFHRLAEPEVRQQLQRRCERAGHAERAAGLVDWFDAVVHTPLPPLHAPLAALTVQVPELEFWMPSAALDAAALDALCCQHLLPGVARPALPRRRLRGLLMGFADLVFEHGGRYWVLDYKSNALGEGDAAYGPRALASAMAAHRYDVQAALYMAALHRLLRARLGPAYDPARHLGGAVYLFLRGVHGAAQGCVHLPPVPALLEGIDALLGVGEAVEDTL